MAKAAKKEGSSKAFLIIAVLAAAVIVIYFSFFSKKESVEYKVSTDKTEEFKNIKEPQFVKEGELEFFKKDGKEPIKKIEIEVADNPKERTQGLMYRRSMSEDKGMLFIFEKEQPQSFWMKNTILPLDIMYVNSKNEIVKIHKNTTPFSEISIPSGKPAIYVVEVNAGFSDKYKIQEGDIISFTQTQ